MLNLLELSKKVTKLLVLLHGLRISTLATFDINQISMSNDTCNFYPSEPLKLDRQVRPRDKIIYKKFENSKLCLMAATMEHLKHRAEYNVAHTKFLFTTASSYGLQHKDTIAKTIHRIFETNSTREIAHYLKSLISVFQQLFATRNHKICETNSSFHMK